MRQPELRRGTVDRIPLVAAGVLAAAFAALGRAFRRRS